MTDITDSTIEKVSGIQGTLRFPAVCGIITSETQLQAGLRPTGGDGPRRLFFGEHTDPASFALIEEFKDWGIDGLENGKAEVEVSGYFKERGGLLDGSALFVEELSIIG